MYRDKTVGHVEISDYGTACRCKKCGKSLAYPAGSKMNLLMWEELKRIFIEKHRKCGESPSAQ